MSTIEFAKVPTDALETIWKRVAGSYGGQKIHFVMDMSACEAINPMDWHRMAKADDFNLWHDVFGIRRHLNRETGKLEDHFSPRFSSRTAAPRFACQNCDWTGLEHQLKTIQHYSLRVEPGEPAPRRRMPVLWRAGPRAGGLKP